MSRKQLAEVTLISPVVPIEYLLSWLLQYKKIDIILNRDNT